MFRRSRSSTPSSGPARRARVLLAAGSAGIALLAAACSTGKDAVDQDGSQFRFVQANKDGDLIPAAKRQGAPDFSGDNLSGTGTLALDDYRGKVLLVNFWGSWCPPCRAEAPDLQSLYAKDKRAGLVVLGVNVKDQESLARGFVRKQGITFPSISDPQSRIALSFRNYPPAAIPSTILIDRKGRVAAIYLGGKTESEFAKVLGPLLAESGSGAA